MNPLHNVGDKVRTKKVTFVIKKIETKVVAENGQPDEQIVYYVNMPDEYGNGYFVKAKDVITHPTVVAKESTKKSQPKPKKEASE